MTYIKSFWNWINTPTTDTQHTTHFTYIGRP